MIYALLGIVISAAVVVAWLERHKRDACVITAGIDPATKTTKTTVVYYCSKHRMMFLSGACPGRSR